MTFPDRLRFLMKQNDITQSALAERLCTSQQTVSRWVTGKFQPDIDQLITMAKLFNVSVDYLIGYSDTPVIIFDTKKDPSPKEEERARNAALSALADDAINQPMPKDRQELSDMIQQIVDRTLGERSTPTDGQQE